METTTIFPAAALRGETTVPGDKSISHRALILSSQARGESRLGGLSRGEDVRDTSRALRALGVSMSRWDEEPLLLSGSGPGGWREPEDVLDFGNSGTGFRLMGGMLAAHPFFSVLSGDRYLLRRPMKRIVEPLRLMGAEIDGRCGGTLPPLAVRGGRLRGTSFRTTVASAQVKSAILLAGLLAEGETTVTEPALSRDHTERMLLSLGVDIRREKATTLHLRGGQEWAGMDLTVPGDPSSAAFLLAAALIVPDSEVTVRNVCTNPTRTGFLEIIAAMGGDITVKSRGEAGGEPVADITARTSSLRGIEVPPALVPSAIDEFPILAALALFADGRTTFTGAGELRVKESDRISTMAAELTRLGGKVRELEDGLEIEGGRVPAGGLCRSHGDHRVAMAAAVVGCAAGGEVTVEDTACVKTSFPGFLEKFNGLGGRMESRPAGEIG